MCRPHEIIFSPLKNMIIFRKYFTNIRIVFFRPV